MPVMMPQRDRRVWAKEEMMCGIDARMKEIYDDDVGDVSMDDWDALVNERNRIARFLKQPIKTRKELHYGTNGAVVHN